MREASIESAKSVTGAGRMESATITIVVQNHISEIGVWPK
jgi:hypothetical protein